MDYDTNGSGLALAFFLAEMPIHSCVPELVKD